MAKIKLEFAGFDEMLKKLNALEADTKKIADEAIRKSFEIVTEAAAEAVSEPNLPAGGRYSSGDTKRSLVRTPEITWSGTVATVPVGFNIKQGGLPSVFMMLGTPKRMKVQAVYDAFYGDRIRGEYLNAQREIFHKAMEELTK